jgi:long-chain acyl-CoA synthetase
VPAEKTIANLWRNAMAEGRQDPAYLHEVDGEWREVTWADAATQVDELANGLPSLGIAKGDSFALLERPLT